MSRSGLRGAGLFERARRSVCLAAVCLGLGICGMAQAARTSLENRYQIQEYPNGGKPDLTVDPIRLKSQLNVIDRYFDENDPADQCVFEEGAIKAFGWRRLMVFDVVIVNAGDADLHIGNRADPGNYYAPIFYFDRCHGHYHMRDFSEYLVRDGGGTVVAAGHKMGFCFEDSFKYTDHPSSGYNCEDQGITRGWGDWYYKQLPGQWVDVTDLPPGSEYTLEVNINLQEDPYKFPEGENRYPDSIQVPAAIPKRNQK